MTLSQELTWRGFVNQTTYKNITLLDKDPITFYWGVDPSADSMHIGQLAMAMMIRHFMDHGHNAVLLVGGATGMIGDPDGKNEERALKPEAEVVANKKAISDQYDSLFAGKTYLTVDNYDWFKDIGYLDFLRDIGKHMSMTQMLDREFVKSRIGESGSGLSYAEFSYSLIQGYDFLYLFRKHDVTLQICGADQWGNSLSGVEMIRKLESGEAHVFSAPLIVNKASGQKFGKTESGAIWLNENKTSVFQFYQFWLNLDDEGVIDYLKIFTMINKIDIDHLSEATRTNPGDREAQKALAFEVTKLVHGENRAENARNVSSTLFGDTPFSDLLEEELDMLAREIPLSTASNVVDALVMSELASGNNDARRLIGDGAVSVNGTRISSDQTVSVPSLIKKGKNSFILVR